MEFQPPIRPGVHCELHGYSTSGEVIGKGATAFVYKGTCNTTGDTIAIKEIDFSRLGNISMKQRQLMESEIVIMRQLSQFKHENILSLRKDFFLKSNNGYEYQYLILDYCNGEDFHQYSKKKRMKFEEEEAKYFMTQFARGLKFMRLHNISHRDLKPQNLLIQETDKGMILKIADFGYAKVFETQDLSATHCGSPLYMAPEIHDRQRYSVKADLWSVGIILYQICCGHAPFAAVSLQDLTWKLKTQPITFSARESAKLSPECKDLIIRLLQKNAHRRISWDEFFNHTFFDTPISLPENMIEKMDPEIEEQLNDCLVLAELADNLASEYGRNGEVLTLYIKFLNQMKGLFRILPDKSSALKICLQHYFMYLEKSRQMAQTTTPQGVPEKLIFAAFMQYSNLGSNAEGNKDFAAAKYNYMEAEKYLQILTKESVHGNDKIKLQKTLNLLRNRIEVVSSVNNTE